MWRELRREIEQWIELGQPDESRLRKASGRARKVVVVGYGGNAADMWWKKNAATLARLGNLTVIDIDPAGVEALTGSSTAACG